MARDRREEPSKLERATKRLQQASTAAVQVALLPQTIRERVNGHVYPVARAVGAVGLVLLVTWAALRALDEAVWEHLLEPERLPLLLTLGLCGASLLGWACMTQGMRRVRARLGPRPSGLLFVWLPVVCGLLTLLAARDAIEPAGWPGSPAPGAFIRWYPPLLVVSFVGLNLLAIARDEDQGGHRAALGEAVLCIPYALLLLAFVLGTWASPELQASLEETTHALGAGAIVLQVGLAWFVSAGAAAA